jgi:hypothetical protein
VIGRSGDRKSNPLFYREGRRGRKGTAGPRRIRGTAAFGCGLSRFRNLRLMVYLGVPQPALSDRRESNGCPLWLMPLHRRAEVADVQQAEEQGAVGQLACRGEAGLPHQGQDALVSVFGKVRAGVDPAREQSVALVRRGEVGQVKRAVTGKHAARFAQHPPTLVRRKMVEHERGKHAVKRRVREGDLAAKALLKADSHSGAFRLAPGAGQGLGVGIEPGDVYLVGAPSARGVRVMGLGLGMPPLDLDGQRAGAAADVEHALPAFERRLAQKLVARPRAAQQPGHQSYKGSAQSWPAAGR